MIPFFSGLGLGLSLIVAIGAQNVFLLRQGIRKEHVLPVVVICALSDAVLILAGVGGLGAIISSAPWIVVVARWLGAAFLFVYGLMAARRAWRGTEALHIDEPVSVEPAPEPSEPGATDERTAATGGVRLATRPTATVQKAALAPVILAVLAITWLNPHVYLDTVLLVGSVGATHGADRWVFAAGAVLASTIWFITLGFGARHLGRWLDTPKAWRVLDGIIAVVMVGLAVSLVAPVLAG